MNPKTETPNLLLSVVADAYTTDPDDCFSKDWEHNNQQCMICSMQNVCMILSTSNVKKAMEMANAKFSPWVDEIDFSLVPKENLLAALKQNAYPLQDLRDFFAHYSNCKDTFTVNTQVNLFIREHKLTLQDGQVSNNN